MANVDIISVALTDYKDDTRRVLMYVPVGHTIAELQAFSNAFVAVLDDVTGALPVASTLTYNLTLPAVKPAAITLHDNEKGGNFGFDVADTPYRHTLRVPAILESLTTGESIEIASGAGQTFVNFVRDVDLTVLPTDKFGADIGSALSALVTFHK